LAALGAAALAVLLACVVSAPVEEDVGEFDTLEKPSLFEGDMAGFLNPALKFDTTAEEEEYLSNALKNGILQGRWAGGKMPYVLSDKFTANERKLVLDAIAEINDNAKNFKVVPRNGEVNYVNIVRGGPNTGCYSYVGNIQQRAQTLNLQARVNFFDGHCFIHGIIVHELFHAVGFLHEQARTDRNDYVEINWANIPADYHRQFEHYDSNSITAFGQPYDYLSLMHYEKYDFAINPSVWTIRRKEPSQQHLPVGQRDGLTPVDIAKLNAMY